MDARRGKRPNLLSYSVDTISRVQGTITVLINDELCLVNDQSLGSAWVECGLPLEQGVPQATASSLAGL